MNPFSHRQFQQRPVRAAVLQLGLALLISSASLIAAQAESAAKPGAAKAATAPIQIISTLVKAETVPLVQTGPGNVLPLATVTVKARIDGQLEGVEFKEGQDVKAGQLLARLDGRSYQAQLDQALAQKAKDQALLENAELDLKRLQQLIQDEATTQQALDTQAALVRQLRANLQNDEAQINLARVQLSYTRIHAPISGRVGARLIDPGNIVHAADAGGLLVINQIDPIGLQFTLPESLFQALNKAVHNSRKPLKVQALARNDQQEVLAEGELSLVNNQIDAATGSITLRARFPNAQHKLWPGQSLNARITLAEQGDALTLPSQALQRGQNGLFVYVVNADDRVRAQPVSVGQGDALRTIITQGLKAGERVVVDGQYRLSPGALVVEAKAASSNSAAAGGKP